MRALLILSAILIVIFTILSIICDLRKPKDEITHNEELTAEYIISLLGKCDEIDLSNVSLKIKEVHKPTKKTK